MKKCRVCEIELTDDNWMPSLKAKNSVVCRTCSNIKSTEWRNKNRELYNKQSRIRYFKNPQKFHAVVNKARKQVRIDMLIAYGGKCCSCSIDDFEVLDIDHIDNSGAKDRKNNLWGYNLYRHLKKLGWPKENFQLLCKNCNWKKHLRNLK
jgi:transposase-like protein